MRPTSHAPDLAFARRVSARFAINRYGSRRLLRKSRSAGDVIVSLRRKAKQKPSRLRRLTVFILPRYLADLAKTCLLAAPPTTPRLHGRLSWLTGLPLLHGRLVLADGRLLRSGRWRVVGWQAGRMSEFTRQRPPLRWAKSAPTRTATQAAAAPAWTASAG